MNSDNAIEPLVRAGGFSKSLKFELIPATATLLHPRTGDVITVNAGYRRMTDGEIRATQVAEAERRAANHEITDVDILEFLAPLFGRRDGSVEIDLDDFPGEDAGTPEERFRAYFGAGTDEELEVERKILRVHYRQYLAGFFRLLPMELVQVASDLSLRSSGATPVLETPVDEPRSGV